MMKKSGWSSLAILGAAFLFVLLPCRAMTPEQENELQSLADKELSEMIDFLVNKETFCRDYLGLEYPVTPPTDSIGALDKEVEARVHDEAFRKYPEGQRAVFFKEAYERFSLYKLTDLVEVRLKDSETPVKGRLRAINEFDVLIDNKTIRFDEMEPDSLARFRKDASEKRITQYVELKMRHWQNERTHFIQERREQVEQEVYTAAGYILKLGEWVPKETYFEEELAKYRSQVAEKLKPLLLVRVYMDAGYRLYKEIWMTPEEIAKIKALEAKKNEFEPEFQAELDKLNQENDESTAGGTRVEGGALWGN